MSPMTAFDALLLAKGREIAEALPYVDSERTSTVSYAMGFQTALELAMLDPEVARQVIDGIHQRQVAQDDGSAEEHNETALEFLAAYHHLNGSRS